MTEREEKIQKLKEYFEKRDDVVMAFVFGSQAEEQRIHNHSDWDVGVYFTPTTENRVEWEEQGREYPEEDKAWSDCIKILNTDDVDLVVLNRAPASIADSAIRGVPLTMKDRSIFLDFMLIITREAEDYRRFAKDYADIYWRSASLTPKDAERLNKTLEFLNTQKTLYGYFRNFTREKYEENLVMRGAIERWLENIANAVIDSAKIILASSKRPDSGGYVSIVRFCLYTLGGFSEEAIVKFEGWIKFRNVLAHEYLDIKWKKIENFIRESEPFILQFIAAARTFVEQNASREEQEFQDSSPHL